MNTHLADPRRMKLECVINYSSLLDAILSPHAAGTARCRTPIKASRLNGLITWMNEQGWDAEYEVIIGPDGYEYVNVYWNAAAQYPEADTPLVPIKGIIYNEKSRRPTHEPPTPGPSDRNT